jgi:hypothetical protein
MVIGAAETDKHVALRFVVTNALYEAAARRISADERDKVDSAAVLDVDCLRSHWRDDQ